MGLLSIFNMVGRFFWSSTSDLTGRKVDLLHLLRLGHSAVYYLIPQTFRQAGSVFWFVVICCIIISMYGGGFATIPAYLRDMFGTYQVGAIHGRLITAWSMAAVLGPYILNKMSSDAKAAGVPKELAYNNVMYICVGMLVLGLICNLLVRPVDARYHYTGPEVQPVGNKPPIGGVPVSVRG